MKLFHADQLASLRRATSDFCWLLSRGYPEQAALKIVGDRYDLRVRQRTAVWRCSAGEVALQHRRSRRIEALDGVPAPWGIDGYNLLITLESALSGGVVLIGVDGNHRDLAGLHGTYRRVEETVPALQRVIETLARAGPVDLYLDRPVSNSGRLKALTAELLEAVGLTWNIELQDNPDEVLSSYPGTVISSDSVILDRCSRWFNLAGWIIERHIPEAWTVDLRPGGSS